MSKPEKIIITFLLALAMIGIGISYYAKAKQGHIPLGCVPFCQTAGEEIESSKIININTADSEAISKLPGIGPKLAEEIISYRQKSGSFYLAEDLLKVKGIGPKKLEAIKTRIKFYD